MNIMEENFEYNNKKKSNATTIILIAIAFVTLIIIAISIYLYYLKKDQLKLYVNNRENKQLLELIQFEENGNTYVPIRRFAETMGYQSFSGDYTDKSEDRSKCYIQSEKEVVNFTYQSNEIYKLDLTESESKYETTDLKEPVKSIDGELYISTEDMEKAFNMHFEYDRNTNRISIITLDYLVELYASRVLDLGYAGISQRFADQKAIFQNLLVVYKTEDGPYAVIDLQGNVILEPKYDKISYLTEVGDFLVEVNEKLGVVSKDKKIKLQIQYDSIESVGDKSGLYIVSQDNKYGVIDNNGTIKIYIENDKIGIDDTQYQQNNIKNKYLIAENAIPVKKDDEWLLYDRYGNVLTSEAYDEFGYKSSRNKNTYNLLVIPEYNVIVARKDRKYTLLDSSGKQLMGLVADDIYMIVNNGERSYKILANNKEYDAEAYLDAMGVSISSKKSSSSNRENKTTEETTNINETENTNGNYQSEEIEENNNVYNNESQEEYETVYSE